MKFTTPAALIVLATSLNLPVIAEEQSPIIVTATRTAQTVDDSLASVTVITKKDIQQSQSKSLPEILNQVMGIDFSNNGGYGKETNLYIRGTNPGHTLVLIDGVKVGSATSGKISFQYIPVSLIERIEIVRGPRSSLYGSEAIGGVIQIFTKQGKGETTTHASIGTGSKNTQSISAGISGGNKSTSYSINAEHFKTDGITARTDSIRNPDEDGYENNSANLTLSHSFNNKTKLSLSALQAKGTNEYDSSGVTNTYHYKFLQKTIAAKLNINATKNWETILGVTQSNDDSDTYKNDIYADRYNTQRKGVNWQNNIIVNEKNTLSLGIDYIDDKVVSSKTYSKTSRDNSGVYAQYQWYGDNNDVLVALRNDDNESYGNNATGNISWGNNLSKTLRVRASHGTAFMAPTFNQLYNPGSGDAANLPEESINTEIGLKGKLHKGMWEANIYQNTIKNLLEYNFGTKKFENVSNAQITGFETAISTSLANWDIKTSISLLDPKNTDTNKQLRRRATQVLSLSLDRQFSKLHIGLDVIAKNDRFDNASNSTTLDGYELINLRASYELTKQWKLNAKVDNLFDEQYETINNYNSPGVSGFVSIQYINE